MMRGIEDQTTQGLTSLPLRRIIAAKAPPGRSMASNAMDRGTRFRHSGAPLNVRSCERGITRTSETSSVRLTLFVMQKSPRETKEASQESNRRCTAI